MANLAIKAKWVLSETEGKPCLLEDRYVLVEGDKISGIISSLPDKVSDIIDLDDALVLPGFINLHNHLSTAALTRGLTEDITSASYAATLIYDILLPVADLALTHLTKEDVRAVIDLAMLEVIKGGTTTLMDVFRGKQVQNFEAAIESGLRFYGAPYVFGNDALSVNNHPAALSQWWELFNHYDGLEGGRIKVALSPHGVDTCDPELLRAVRAAADELGAFITIHLAQSEQEQKQILARYGKTPVALLNDLGVLGPDLLAAHCLYANDHDLDLLRETDSVIVNCPMTFARGGLTAPFSRFAGKGIRTVLGTDGYIMDMPNEIRMAGLISKLDQVQSDVATAWELITAATSGAAA